MFQATKSLFEPKLDFKPHLLNPFDMGHRGKTAVKFSIFEGGNGCDLVEARIL